MSSGMGKQNPRLIAYFLNVTGITGRRMRHIGVARHLEPIKPQEIFELGKPFNVGRSNGQRIEFSIALVWEHY